MRERTGVAAPSHELREGINAHFHERLSREGCIVRADPAGAATRLEGLYQREEVARIELCVPGCRSFPPSLQAARDHSADRPRPPLGTDVPYRDSRQAPWNRSFTFAAAIGFVCTHFAQQTAVHVARLLLVGYRCGSYALVMSEAIAFDTHRFVKRLTDCGFTEQQAETLAEEHVALLNSNLATKADVARIEADIDALRQATKADIAKVEAGIDALRQETKADIAKVEARIEAAKSDLMKWLIGLLIAQGGLIVALVKLL